MFLQNYVLLKKIIIEEKEGVKYLFPLLAVTCNVSFRFQSIVNKMKGIMFYLKLMTKWSKKMFMCPHTAFNYLYVSSSYSVELSIEELAEHSLSVTLAINSCIAHYAEFCALLT
jgi:hypothetical protein